MPLLENFHCSQLERLAGHCAVYRYGHSGIYFHNLFIHSCQPLLGYDSYPIISILFKNNMEARLIMNGQKILQITYAPAKIKFRDSVNFIQCRLADFTKAFQLEEAKTYFPYRFNSGANMDYVGPLPALEHYDRDSMKPKELREFEQWWCKEDQRLRDGKLVPLLESARNQAERNKILSDWKAEHGDYTDLVWDFQKTLTEYCKMGKYANTVMSTVTLM